MERLCLDIKKSELCSVSVLFGSVSFESVSFGSDYIWVRFHLGQSQLGGISFGSVTFR